MNNGEMYIMRKPKNRLTDLIKTLPDKINMVEIGCYAGESMELFQQSGKIKKYYAVDIWDVPEKLKSIVENPIKPENHKFVYENIGIAEKQFDEKAAKYNNIVKLKMDIKKAKPLIKHKIDFIYIDGDHSYEGVKFDIEYAKKIIKKNGIIAGHDFNFKGIEQAVREAFPNYEIQTFRDTSWLIQLI